MSIPEDCRYTNEHEWAKQEQEGVRVGITDYAQTELGDVVFVEVPDVGTEVTKGGSFCSVESVKAVSDIYSPVDGKIVAVNDALTESPDLINSDPHTQGWIALIEANDESQLDALKSAEDYSSYIAELSK